MFEAGRLENLLEARSRLGDEAEQKVLGADVFVFELLRLRGRGIEGFSQ